MALAQVGAQGQERIAAASALVVGVGGLGCAAATYLASAGVGQLFLLDFDTVDATNLGRQVLFGPVDIGEAKAAVAADRLAQQNPARCLLFLHHPPVSVASSWLDALGLQQPQAFRESG